MSDVLVLEIDSIPGNCEIEKFKGKIIVHSYSHGVSLPLSMDVSNAERTSGRPAFSEISLSKMSDLSTTAMYKACSQGTPLGTVKLHVGRVENGTYMNFFTYQMFNAVIANISTSGGGGIPSDSFSINFTKIQCDYTQQQTSTNAKGTATWNWNLETMKAD